MLYLNNNIKEDISTLMKIDTGENEHICNNLKYFYGIKFKEYRVWQVGGGRIKSKGFGLVFIQLKGIKIVIPLYKVYYFPENPRNTLSLQILKYYNGYKRENIESLDSFSLEHDNGYKFKCEVDKIKITIFQLNCTERK